MDRDKLQSLVNSGMTQRDIADHVGKSHSSVRYWFKKLNIFPMRGNHGRNLDLPDRKICCSCKADKPSEDFYIRKRSGNSLTGMCKDCNAKTQKEKRRKFKSNCIEYKGGECSCCGYNASDQALDFHHINPSDKDFEISKYRGKFSEKVIKELDKCMLVCSNCHREIHAGYRKK